MKRITIIGGGASGTLLAVNLIKHAGDKPLAVNLIEKKSRLNRGLAYSTAQDVHLLNVPAAKMGAFPDRVTHFHEWLTAQGYDYQPTDFAPRKLYGNYLSEIFQQTIAQKADNIQFNYFDGEAVDIEFDSQVSKVLTDSGETIESDETVIAFGNFLPANLPTINREYIESPKYFRNAYDTEIVEKIAPDDEILLIGTGLTAVDNILSFYHRGHRGKITMLSTHGWLPTVHAKTEVYPNFDAELKGAKDLLQLFKIVRQHCERAENWRGAIDAMRSATPQIWLELPFAEKRRFMRRVRRLWDISRHRIPPACAAICEELEKANKLEIVSGKIVDIIQKNGGKFTVVYKYHGAEKSLQTGTIINCTGSESNFQRLESTLVRNLLKKGAIKPDALRMGLDAAPDGKLIGQNDQVSEHFWTLSNALKGILYETTAMPEIRSQAHSLALKLIDA